MVLLIFIPTPLILFPGGEGREVGGYVKLPIPRSFFA